MSFDLASQEAQIQSLADVLSLLAILGGMDKPAVQRVLISLGRDLLHIRQPLMVDRELATRLLVQIAKTSGEQAALDIADDMQFVAQAWRPVLDDYFIDDPHRMLPFAEIVYALTNYTGNTLYRYGAFEQFGGADSVLPMVQLTSALSAHHMPRPGLTWELVGFDDPPDQVLVASDTQALHLLKAASSATSLRFSELERGGDEDPALESEVAVSTALFAAFTAGLLGDMLFYAARLRNHAALGREVWERIHALIMPTDSGSDGTRSDY